MLQIDEYHYFLLYIRDKIYRAGILGNKDDAMEYFKTYKDEMNVSAQVTYCGVFKLPFTSDLDDVDKRMGNNHLPTFTIKTFKLITLIMTKSKAEDTFEKLMRNHDLVRVNQQRIIDREKEKEMKKNERNN
jgi:hypothetical protein